MNKFQEMYQAKKKTPEEAVEFKRSGFGEQYFYSKGKAAWHMDSADYSGNFAGFYFRVVFWAARKHRGRFYESGVGKWRRSVCESVCL